MEKMTVAIDQDACTSCGLCEEIQPKHFFIPDGGQAHVKEAGAPSEIVCKGIDESVVVLDGLERSVIQAAEDCPVECIYVGLT